MTEQHHKSGSRLCKIKKQRRLKVREAYHSYQLNQAYPDKGKAIGEIQLKGKWLIQAGFTIDTPVTVRVMEGCLVLTAES